jgi:hypothetical protein
LQNHNKTKWSYFCPKTAAFQGESGTAGYFMDPLRRQENSDGVAMLTRTGGGLAEKTANWPRPRGLRW